MRRTDEANTDERRRQIVEAAARCFNSVGLHGASNSVICKEAGVSPGHLYYYFENREALIQAVFNHNWAIGQRYLDALVDMSDGLSVYLELVPPADESLSHEPETNRAFVLDVLGEVSRNPAIAEVNKAHRRQFLEKLTQIARAAERRGELADGADIEAVVFAVDMIATARDVSVAALRHDQGAYEKNTRLLLQGLLKMPSDAAPVPQAGRQRHQSRRQQSQATRLRDR